MIREEIIENLWGQAILRNLDLGKGELTEIVDYVLRNYEPNVSAELDEAAEKYGIKMAHGENNYVAWYHKYGFKAGAEWMASRGLSYDAEIKEGANFYWVDEENPATMSNMLEEHFTPGDKVIVQIRKA